MPAPLPEVPSDKAQLAAPEKVNSALRAAMLLLMLSIFGNVVRTSTYAIGAMQFYGQLGLRDMLGVAVALGLVILGLKVVDGLRHCQKWAWWTVVLGAPICALPLAYELWLLLQWRARGYHQTEVQITLLICMLGMMLSAVLYLLSRNGRIPLQLARRESATP
jgi:hypothetical protein